MRFLVAGNGAFDLFHKLHKRRVQALNPTPTQDRPAHVAHMSNIIGVSKRHRPPTLRGTARPDQSEEIEPGRGQVGKGGKAGGSSWVRVRFTVQFRVKFRGGLSILT